MSELQKLKTDFKEAKLSFENGITDLKKEYQKHQDETIGYQTLDANVLNKEKADWAFYYCLSETIEQCDRVIKEKPSREMALVKTKLQEAIFWLNEA